VRCSGSIWEFAAALTRDRERDSDRVSSCYFSVGKLEGRRGRDERARRGLLLSIQSRESNKERESF
jgi:hypothetical protein